MIWSRLDRNLEERETLLFAVEHEETREQVLDLCRRSPLFWINYFVWTYNVKTVDKDGFETPAKEQHVPFITWPVQNKAFRELKSAMDEGRDALIDKSRDMGASWICITMAVWLWLFSPGAQVLLTSRVEDLVDRSGDPDTLFWKIDYIIKNLPPSMVPGKYDDFQRGNRNRSHMQLVNPVTGATISGQATTEHIGRGGRRTIVLFDEMASMQNGRAAWQSAADTTSCRIANSTPLGSGTEFTRLWERGIKKDSPRIVTLGYWDHPYKGKGREWRMDEDGDMTGTAGRWYWWTPWFQYQVDRRGDTADIGQNVLIDHTTSGDLFFSASAVSRHIQGNAKPPKRCEIDKGKFFETDSGRWYVWDIPEADNYVMFADIASGKGSSNSAVGVMSVSDGTIVAEFVDPFISPHDLAEEVALAGTTVFSGGVKEAFLGWEVNGPGEAFYEDVRRQDYRNVYYQRATGQRTDRKSRRYGWRSDRRNKRILLSALSRSITKNEIMIQSETGLKEMLEYMYFEDGSIGPGTMRDERTGARESHGDRVIAYAGCVFLRKEMPQYESVSPTFLPGTAGEILKHSEVWESMT